MVKSKGICPDDILYHKQKLNGIFDILSKKDVYGDTGFSADKNVIQRVFSDTNGYKKDDILIRLTIIDSMYSTQMGRRYYALDELAAALAIIAQGEEDKLKEKFLKFVENPAQVVNQFDYTTSNKRKSNLFSENYGIGKDGRDKGVAISLISKYAYFLTGYKFPIYDSIACEMYPLVWKYSGFSEKMPRLKVTIDGKIMGAETMVRFVQGVNLLIAKLDHKNLNYDLLDRFLWFVGKIRRGNLSLILTREQYEDVINKTRQDCHISKENISTEYFNIDKVNIENFEYIKNNKLLNEFFEMAKLYGHK